MSSERPRDDVRRFLETLNALPGPRLHELTPVEARVRTRAMRDLADLPVGALAVRRDHAMPGPAGGTIALRLHDTRADRAAAPILVFFHGGGWVFGDLDTYEPVCAAIARGLDLPVVAVEYRLAPEHPFPAAPEDCEAAARWIAANAAALGLSGTALVLAGDSAGGALAIATGLALRDAPAALPLAACWAAYPGADMLTRYPSYKRFGTGHLLDRDALRWFAECYRADLADPRASPLLADLAGFPPTLVTTAELDPIRDQGRALAAALVQAGVPTIFREAEGMIHGFLNLRRAIPSAQADLAGDLAVLRSLIEETA